jgi:hypothetical protein
LEVVELILEREQKKPAFLRFGLTAETKNVSLTDYHKMIDRIRHLVAHAIPADAQIAVVSRGDDELLTLNEQRGWHFPQAPNGQYAGYHPANSADAIRHLQTVKEKGAVWLVFPKTGFWWFDYYPEFRQHLERKYPDPIRDLKSCVIYALTPAAALRARSIVIRNDQSDAASVTGQKTDQPVISPAVEASAISVVIPTFNRAHLLSATLESLAAQSLPPDKYEVLVIDDGSTDQTRQVVESFSNRLPLRYFSVSHKGIAAAKNRGIQQSKHPIVFFFDDDDVADRHLLREHLQSHQEHPRETTAILGYTAWARSLRITEVMRFITGVGRYLFSYDGLEMFDPLDFTYFWGGRTSCKRSLLETIGGFDERFEFGCEDIELAYRLWPKGFEVILNRCAVQYMNRPVTYDQFCRRCERQGQSQFELSQLHPYPVIRRWCGVNGARETWRKRKPMLGRKVARVHQIESLLGPRLQAEERSKLILQLHQLYWWTFDTFKLKGIVEKMNASGKRTPVREKPALIGAGLSTVGDTL